MTDRRSALVQELVALEVRRSELFAELLSLNTVPEDELLTVEETAGVLKTTTDWLYRHARQLPFTVRPGPGQVRFSKLGLQEYLRRKRGR